MWLPILLLLIGFVILIKGADFLVNGASSIAKKNGISNLAIGLTVVAFGTSLPELIVSLFAAVDGNVDMAFGNVIGSNTFNLLFILGVSGLIYPLVVQRNTVKYEVPLSLLAAGLLFVLVNDNMIWGSDAFSFAVKNDDGIMETKIFQGVLGRLDSIILLVFFVLFLYYIYRTMTSSTDLDEGDSVKLYSNAMSIGMIVLGIGALVGGGRLVVVNAEEIAYHFGLSKKFVGLTVLAAGTSLPELATSAMAAYRKNTDIAIGNVVGSNIFNVFFILGVTGVITPIPYSISMNTDIYVLCASTVLLMVFMFTLNTRKLDRWEAAIMLVLYIAYTLYLLDSDTGSAATTALIR